MHSCNQCGATFTRKSNLNRHKTENRCKSGVECSIPSAATIVGQKRSAVSTSFDEIPTFDGSEFGTGKPKSKTTLERMEQAVCGRAIGNKGPFSPLLSSRYDKNPKIQKLIDAVINKDTSKSVMEKKDDFQFGFNSMEAAKEAKNRFSKAAEPMIE